MADTTTGRTGPSELRKVVAASLVGTALEWYDFFIYGTAAALVFNQLFFTDADPAVGTIAAFATFGVGFLVRPIGGVFFGHLGDRIGRRSTLVITTLVMGVSTGLIGLLPSYDSIGLWAPVLLTALRVCQGLGAGAEFGGASTLLAEHSPPGRRGYYGSFAQTGVQIGLLLGTLSFLLIGLLPEATVLAWAWRVPFLISFAMIGVSLYVRLRVAESPVFRRIEQEKRVVRLPIKDAVMRYPRSVLVGIGAHICDTAIVYMLATFSVAYLTAEVGLSNRTALTGVILFVAVVIVLQPLYGRLSDRIGRKPLNLFSVVFAAAFAYPYFWLLNTGVPALAWLAMVITGVFAFAPQVAVQPAFYAELFGARVRYTGFAASRELGAAVAGFSPLIGGLLLRQAGGDPWLVALFVIGTAVVSFIAFAAAAETRDMDVTELDPAQTSLVSKPTVSDSVAGVDARTGAHARG